MCLEDEVARLLDGDAALGGFRSPCMSFAPKFNAAAAARFGAVMHFDGTPSPAMSMQTYQIRNPCTHANTHVDMCVGVCVGVCVDIF